MDKHHGEGGSYEIDQVTRERRLKEERKPEPAGGGPRDKDGKPLADKTPATERAMPAPGRAPWEADPEPAATPKKKGA